MRESDYRRLEDALSKDLRAGLAAFAAETNCQDVYAVALGFDDHNGGAWLALDTERAYEEDTIPRYPCDSPRELRQLCGSRWNPAEFRYLEIAPLSSTTEKLIERYAAHLDKLVTMEAAERHQRRFADVMVEVLHRLSPELDKLDRTADFITYPWEIDSTEVDHVARTRRTIPPVLFDRLFPEVRAAEELMASLAKRPAEEQAAFWAAAVEDFFLESDSEMSRQLRLIALHRYHALEALVGIGEVALPQLLRIAESHALAEEWNKKGSAAWKRLGAQTPSGNLASTVLLTFQKFSGGPDELIERLQSLLQRLHDKDRDRRHTGINCQITARALHALRPNRFPRAVFSDKTNHLLNPQDFGVY